MNDSNQQKPKPGSAPKPALNFLLMGAGSMFTSMLAAGFLVGFVLDTLFETTPIFMMVCGVMGFIGGLQKVHKLSSKLDPVPEKEEKDDQKS
ncbi:MAG: AtpZ/AtpI family protein [Pseudomonadota bacterium]|nr:AtpZ/AtpI family protein [Pseudomonadota bacterium]